MTVGDLIRGALQRLGVLSEAEPGSADMLNDGLTRLNDLLDQLKAEELALYAETRTVGTITSGTASYSVGTGGIINTPRPVYVDNITFQDTSQTPTLEMQMQMQTVLTYSNINLKAQESNYPSAYWYNPTFPLATVTLWPVPTSTTLQLVVYSKTQVAEFAAITDTLSLPPGWKRMLVTNLAVEMAPEYHQPVTQDLQRQADNSKATVKRSNIKLEVMNPDPGTIYHRDGQYGYNIYAGP